MYWTDHLRSHSSQSSSIWLTSGTTAIRCWTNARPNTLHIALSLSLVHFWTVCDGVTCAMHGHRREIRTRMSVSLFFFFFSWRFFCSSRFPFAFSTVFRAISHKRKTDVAVSSSTIIRCFFFLCSANSRTHVTHAEYWRLHCKQTRERKTK